LFFHQEGFTTVPIEVNCNASLLIEVLYSADEVFIDVVVVHDGPDWLLEVYEYVVLLVLTVFLT
jgi:hypothetical protein